MEEENIITIYIGPQVKEEKEVKVEQVETPVEPAKEKPVEEGQEKDEELESYSKRVKRRIDKLTTKMREAERQKEEALRYADSIKRERDQFKTTADSLDKNYVAEMEGRITSSLALLALLVMINSRPLNTCVVDARISSASSRWVWV